MKSIRRVVTGHAADGRSTILFDDQVGPRDGGGTTPGVELVELWSTSSSPAGNDGRSDQRRTHVQLLPDAQGSLFRVFEVPPEAPGTARPGAGPEAHPGFHTTDSVDYIVVLRGEIYAMVDDGEALLRPGDVLIQRGTSHAWSNRGDQPCLMAAVMLDAEPASS